MSYRKLITKATGEDEPAAVALIEELMRVQHPTLDGLPPGPFASAARAAAQDARLLRDEGELAGFCEVFGLAVPSWAT